MPHLSGRDAVSAIIAPALSTDCKSCQLIFAQDDETVVVMTTNDYLSGDEDLRRRELVWGVVREPPAPLFGHQTIVTQITCILNRHVRDENLGIVCVSPADVVLDAARALIVQPDVFYISNERKDIIRDQVWGAPDLVVEVASPGTARYDRLTKIEWYRMYGVRECWLVDPGTRSVTVVNLRSADEAAARRFTADARVESAVLPRFTTTAREFFD